MIPDNGGYATAAYIAAAIIYVGYALSVRSRAKRLAERLAHLAEQHGERH
jgi:hypothetical protein